MAINFDKNKINNTGTAEVVTTPSVSPAPDPSVSPKPNVEFEGQYYQPSEDVSATPTDEQDSQATAARQRSSDAHANAVAETARMKAAAEAVATEASNDSRVAADAELVIGTGAWVFGKGASLFMLCSQNLVCILSFQNNFTFQPRRKVLIICLLG